MGGRGNHSKSISHKPRVVNSMVAGEQPIEFQDFPQHLWFEQGFPIKAIPNAGTEVLEAVAPVTGEFSGADGEFLRFDEGVWIRHNGHLKYIG